MNLGHPMGVLHSFSIKNIFYDKMDLKVVSATFLIVWLLRLKESTFETSKKLFISLLKVFSFLR